MAKKRESLNAIPVNAPEGRTQSVFLNTLGTQETQPVRTTYTHSWDDEDPKDESKHTYGMFINFLKSKASVWLSLGDAKRQGIMREDGNGGLIVAHKELGFEANVTAGVAGKFIVPAEVLEEA